MVSGTLYTFPVSHVNVWANKILIASKFAKTDVVFADDKIGFDFEKTPTTEDFKKKFPLFKVIAFEDKDHSLTLTEADAILYYVSCDELNCQSNVTTETVNRQLVSLASKELHNIMSILCYPGLGLIHPDKTEISPATAQLHRILGYLTSQLNKHHFLSGDKLHIGDIAIFCELVPIFEMYLEESSRNKYTKICHWMDSCIANDHFKSVMHTLKYCTKTVHFDNALFAKLHPDQKNEKNTTEKAAPVKKVKAVEKTQDMETKPEVKKVLFDHLPPTSFVMDEWKRMYSNNDIKISMPWFWTNLDKDGYSLWHGKYKYCDELEKDYLNDNLILGMFRRLSALTKFAFGVVHNRGTSGKGNFELSCVWLMRGQTLAFEIKQDFNDDAVHYEWRKLDPVDEKDKKIVEDYFSRSESIGKYPLIEAHVFK